jgi:hypothetical protein
MRSRWLIPTLTLCLLACSDSAAEVDAGRDAAVADAGRRDAATPDAATPDDGSCEDCTLAAVMPTPGVDCGVQSSEGRAPAVASCVEDNLASSTPFHAVTELQGIDSQVVVGWVLDAAGTLTRYFYDSSICGGSGCDVAGCGPRVSVAICEEPGFIPDEDGGTGFESGDELITCASFQNQPDACGP